MAKIVCLCGSTRFRDAFTKAQLEETLAGRIVLTIGCNMKSDSEIFGHMTEAEREAIKAKLDILHLEKIKLADEVLILNVGGYIGESTARELVYAKGLGKLIRFLEYEKQPTPAPEPPKPAKPWPVEYSAIGAAIDKLGREGYLEKPDPSIWHDPEVRMVDGIDKCPTCLGTGTVVRLEPVKAEPEAPSNKESGEKTPEKP